VRLTEEEAQRLVASARVARLATVGGDGQPHLVPVTFAVDGDLIYTTVDHKPKKSANLRRLRNVRENPRVALLVDHYTEDWDQLWWVRIEGWASVVDDERGLQDPLDVLAERYEQYQKHRPAGPVIVIQVDRWKGWSSSSERPA
jgi:PPOX class probable F420-dependent enzyme